MSIPIIDLFAGPGGLGEGFSSITDKKGNRIFDIKLSIEKDEHAHKTLRLRSFYRKFPEGEAPQIYYDYIKENDSQKQIKLLEDLKEDFHEQWLEAENEACKFELPFPEEKKIKRTTDEKGELVEKEVKVIGYTPEQITQKHNDVDSKIINALNGDNNFLLIGGPPCQAYSLAGRARNQGISNKDHRVHLYKEYLRIIAKHQPSVFVMENVKGLLSAKVDGQMMFDLIKDDLKNPDLVFPQYESQEYKVYSFVKEPDNYDEDGFPIYTNNKDFLIKTEKYGIPQRRHRVILLGVRQDLEVEYKKTLVKGTKETTLKQVIGSLPKIRSGIGREVIGTNEKGNHIYGNIPNTAENWKLTTQYYLKNLEKYLTKNFTQFISSDSQGLNFFETKTEEQENPLYKTWYEDKKLQGVLNHESRTHLKEDIGRYLFSSLYLQAKGEFPRLKDYPEELQPAHKNRKSGKFADRFRTQKPDQAGTTVTSHISKDGHYFIHYDPTQCRSLTVREAARIQTFPDNYYFCGSRTHQYHQVGNAVPPYLAKQLAEIVKDLFK